jgi:hypothetical protein
MIGGGGSRGEATVLVIKATLLNNRKEKYFIVFIGNAIGKYQ